MKICFEQFLNGKHSWGIVGQNLARALANKGHQVHLMSTNGYDNFPADLKQYVVDKFHSVYDMQISYTAMLNFPKYLSHGMKNRFGIWCYEWPIIPAGFTKYHNACDKILAPSNFAREVFLNNKIPPEKVVVVPHGININDYHAASTFKLKTTKKYKILVNIGQQHLRKNIAGMFEAYGLAFNKLDDVCLIAKIHTTKLINAFDIDVKKLYTDFHNKFKQHAEVELITEYVPSMAALYKACDIVYTLSYAEGYYLPGLEAMACNKINIAPRYGGQLDFLNDDNSLLVEGKIIRATPKMQYWIPSIYNTVFEADILDAANKLRLAVTNYDVLSQRFVPHMQAMVSKFTWDNAADQIVNLTKEANG